MVNATNANIVTHNATDDQRATKEGQKHPRPWLLVVNCIKYDLIVCNACVASGGWVPMGQGAATAIHPKAEEHPQAYQPATQPRAPPRQAEGTSV